MQHEFFIKLSGILFVIIAMVSLAGCAGNKDIMPSSSSEISSIAPDISGEDNIVVSSKLAEIIGEGNYEAYIDQLGYLLNSPDWHAVTDISPTDYVMWYAFSVRDQHLSDEMHMSKYLIDNKDGLFIPADEFESEVRRHFNVSIEHLKSDPVIYHETERLYSTPSALEQLAKSFYEITKVIEDDCTIQIDFVLTIENMSEAKTLVLEKDSSQWHYVSYISK